MYNATKTYKGKSVRYEMWDINCERDRRGCDNLVEAAAVKLLAALIPLEIWEAADGQRLFQPWKSHKPLH